MLLAAGARGYARAMSPSSPTLDPPDRLLCGPGPSNVSPAALAAMQAPMLGHLDPALHEILLDVSALLAAAYQADGGLTLALSATGTSGMEAGLCNLLEPGDTVIVGVNGFFGARISEIARRHGAEVTEVTAPLGQPVANADLLEALARHPGARMMAVVHAETSTGVQHPLSALAESLRGSDVLLMADCVTSLGGVEIDVAGWGIDYAYSCTQKCVGAPPGMSPVFVSERALERIRDRVDSGPLLPGPAGAGALLARAARHLPPHGADPRHLRPARRARGDRRRDAGRPLGAARRGGRTPTGAAGRRRA